MTREEFESKVLRAKYDGFTHNAEFYDVMDEYSRLKIKNAEVKKDREEVQAQVSKQLYTMTLGDSIILESLHIKWLVTRVPSGWIYSNITRDANQSVFVPFDNAVQNPFKP